ncbi:MAG: FAD:protein FMN transferase [Actinomycetota bacterium]|nr:FAD:protein FMN transferase [Actinomycetota bacterium]
MRATVDFDVASVEFAALGTTARISVTAPEMLPHAEDILRNQLGALDKAASRFRADSELAAVNAAQGRAVVVSPLFLEAVQVARRAAFLTNGAVDLTMGQALRMAGYDRDFTEVAAVGEPLRVRFAPVPGWQVVEIDEARSALRVPTGVELDLGATAKAFGADRAADAASHQTGAGVLVSLGGDIAVAGPPPPGGWTVFVTDDHRGPAGAPGQSVAIVSGGLATSSTTVRNWRRGDQVLHHLIDPSTGRPAESCWRTVSVAGATCVDANTASAAAILRGPSASGWLDALGLPARLVGHDGHTTVVGGWPKEDS